MGDGDNTLEDFPGQELIPPLITLVFRAFLRFFTFFDLLLARRRSPFRSILSQPATLHHDSLLDPELLYALGALEDISI